jgi:hypothetical protein
MMQFEYKHVRFDYGFVAALDRQIYDAKLTSLLNEHGAQGWELKGCWWDYGYHVHLVFGRRKGGDWEEIDVKHSAF